MFTNGLSDDFVMGVFNNTCNIFHADGFNVDGGCITHNVYEKVTIHTF